MHRKEIVVLHVGVALATFVAKAKSKQVLITKEKNMGLFQVI